MKEHPSNLKSVTLKDGRVSYGSAFLQFNYSNLVFHAHWPMTI